MIRFILHVLSSLALLGLVAAFLLAWWGMEDFIRGQNFSVKNLSYSVIITDRDDNEIHRNFQNENREWVNLEQMPDSLKEMILLAEDKRFYQHAGVDVRSIGRAMVENFQAGGIVQGASTLTQQLARKAFLTDERSYQRKLREVAIALGVETRFSKQEILEMYLNAVPYGPTIHGVRAASEIYFGVPPAQLTPAQSLVLATLPQNPVVLARQRHLSNWLGDCDATGRLNCTPFDDYDYQQSRAESILFAYADAHDWSDDQVKATWQEFRQIQLPTRRSWSQTQFQHWQFYVRHFLAQKGFDLSDYPGGLRIRTSIDTDLHQQVLQYLQSEAGGPLVADWDIENFALTVIDHATRSPLVWVGSKAFWNEQISGQIDMLRADRQVGSTMKPFIFAGMIDEGYGPQTFLHDTAVKFKGDKRPLQNADGLYLGNMRMGPALALSRNVPAAQAFYLAGGEKALKNYLDIFFDMGLNEDYHDHQFGWTLALGTPAMPLATLANAYATLGSGQNRELCPILEVTTLMGDPVQNPCERSPRTVLSPETVFFIASILGDNSLRTAGIWRDALRFPDRTIAVKTGTSNANVNGQILPVDNVIASYTPHATVVMWGGNSSGRPLKSGSFAIYSLSDYWRKVWDIVLTARPDLYGEFTPPDGVVKVGRHWQLEGEDAKLWDIPDAQYLFGSPSGSGTYGGAGADRPALTAPPRQQYTTPRARRSSAPAPAPARTTTAPSALQRRSAVQATPDATPITLTPAATPPAAAPPPLRIQATPRVRTTPPPSSATPTSWDGTFSETITPQQVTQGFVRPR